MAEDKIKRQTEDIYNKYYTQEFNPAKAGSDAFRRAVASQLRDSYEQQRQTGQSYSDLYQQARRQVTRGGAMSDVSGFSGGMKRGQSARASAAEIQALSGIAAQREGAIRDIAQQRQAIPSNALLEAQQADLYTRALQAEEQKRLDSAFEIVGNVKEYDRLTTTQKSKLRALGISSKEDFTNLLQFTGNTRSSIFDQNTMTDFNLLDIFTNNPLVDKDPTSPARTGYRTSRKSTGKDEEEFEQN